MQSCIFLCLSQTRINWKGCGRKSIWRKNGSDGGGLLIGPDGVAPNRIVCVSASCYPILPSTIKSRRSFLLAPAHPGGPGKKAVKWLCVCVCILCFVTAFYCSTSTVCVLMYDLCSCVVMLLCFFQMLLWCNKCMTWQRSKPSVKALPGNILSLRMT